MRFFRRKPKPEPAKSPEKSDEDKESTGKANWDNYSPGVLIQPEYVDDRIVVTSSDPMLERNSAVIDSIIAEEYGGKITKIGG